MLGSAIAVVINCVLGMLWYNPRFTPGRIWMRRTHPNKTPEEVHEGSGGAMALSFVSSVMMSLLLRFILIDFFSVKRAVDAVKFTLGLSCLTTFLEVPHVLFSKHSVDAFVIDQVFNFLTMAAAGLCIFYLG